jgi:protein gp37
MSKTAIPYGEESWSPVTGCSNTCPWCWSRAIAHRFKRSFVPTFHADVLTQPLHWKKPRRVLVAFNGDLFDPHVSHEQIAAVFGVMAACPQHTFLVLTKRAAEMADWFEMTTPRPMEDHGIRWDARAADCWHEAEVLYPVLRHSAWASEFIERAHRFSWPLPNVWLGVSVTNQADADERIPHLLRCPAETHWISAEPLLGHLNLTASYRLLTADGRPAWPCAETMLFGLDWVVAGAQSGPGAPPCDLEWARSLRDQCRRAEVRVPFAWKDPTGYPPLDGVVWSQVP